MVSPTIIPILSEMVRKSRPFLNAREVRELLAKEELAEPNAERPKTIICVNQSSITLSTWHRARYREDTTKRSGLWTPRTVTLPATPHNVSAIKRTCWKSLTSSSQRSILRIENGWKPRQRKAHTQLQALAA